MDLELLSSIRTITINTQDITKEKTKKKQAIVPTEPLAKYIQAKYKHHGAYTRELEQ